MTFAELMNLGLVLVVAVVVIALAALAGIWIRRDSGRRGRR